MRKLYIAIGVLVALAGVAVLVTMFAPMVVAPAQGGLTVTDSKTLAKTALAFVAAPYEDDYQMLRVGGYVDNKTDHTLGKVDLQIQLYDQSNNRKEVVKYTVTNIPAHQRKTYDTVAGTFSAGRTATIKVVSAVVQ